MYISKDAFCSNGFFREAEWITNKHLNFYTFLVGFSDTIAPKGMATIIANLKDDDTQIKLRKISAFTYISQANKDVTEFSYYHMDYSIQQIIIVKISKLRKQEANELNPPLDNIFKMMKQFLPSDLQEMYQKAIYYCHSSEGKKAYDKILNNIIMMKSLGRTKPER